MENKSSAPNSSLREKSKVLVVENEMASRSMLCGILADNYDVWEAEDGLKALKIMEENPGEINLVLLNLILPGMNGLEVLGRIKENGWTDQVPVIVITQDTSYAEIERACSLGAIGFIRYPLDTKMVRYRVENILQLCAWQKQRGQKQRWSIERHLEAVLDMELDIVGTFNFNISQNICSGGISDIKTVLMLQEEGTIDGYIEKALTVIPEEDREIFADKFSRSSLLKAYYEGNTVVSLRHKYLDDNGERRLLITIVDIAKNPATGDIEGFLYAKDITKKYTQDLISDFLINKGYDAIGVIDLLNDRFSMQSFKFGEIEPLVGENNSFTRGREISAQMNILPEDREKFLRNTQIDVIRKRIAEHEPYSFSVHCIENTGEKRFKKYSYYYLNKKYEIVLATVEDVTFEVERDFLTGELNRAGFIQYTERVLEKSREDEQYAILFLDIKGFKALNEILGTKGGDDLLRRISVLLKNSFLEPEAICRITGYDHFLCLVREENLDLDKLQKFLHYTYTYGDTAADIYWQCGIYNIKRDSQVSVSAMCDRARLAKEYVREDYVKSYAVYDKAMKEDYLAKNEITSTLHSALRNREFKIFYQPIYDAQTGRIASAEALIRWDRPGVGMVSPAMFIPALEESGYVSQLDMYVADSVKEFIGERKKQQKFVVPISVNLSWMDFHDKTMMDTLVLDTEKRKNENKYVRYEITETAYTTLNGDNTNIIKRMRNNGTAILIDDFGSGYSSFSTIMEFDFDVIKLDMGFIQKIGINSKSESIINAIIDMAHHINAKVIAEGAETEEQVRFLAKNGCDYIQGFYFSKPLPQDEFMALLDKQNL